MAHTGAVGVWPSLFGLIWMQGRARLFETKRLMWHEDPSAIEEQWLLMRSNVRQSQGTVDLVRLCRAEGPYWEHR